jgi:hypothetical protein
MPPQNFASTANYFAERARRAPAGPIRDRLQRATQLYREKAKKFGHCNKEIQSVAASTDGIPSRRQRLVELFRVHAER